MIPPKHRVILLQAICISAAYFAAAELGHALSLEPGHVAACWPASGLMLAVLMAAPKRAWPALVIGAMIGNFFSDNVTHDRPAWAAVGFAVANAVEGVAGAAVLRYLSGDTFTIRRLKDVLFLFCVSIFAPIPGSILGGGVASFAFNDESFVKTLGIWWTADAVGILIVTPLAWSVLRRKWECLQELSVTRVAELVFCFAVILAVAEIVSSGRYEPFTFLFMVVPLLLWPALRFGTATVAAAVAAMSLLIIHNITQDTGPILRAGLTVPERTLMLQAFLAVTGAPFLALAAMLHERRQTEEELEQRIVERTRQLAEADRRKDHFLAVLAHELRNPIAPLSHALQIWPEVVNNRQRLEEVRQIMDLQVRHMTGLIDDLLDVSRISGGKIQLKLEAIDMNDVVNCAVQGIRTAATNQHQTLDYRPHTERAYVYGDRSRLIQVVGNLLNNAVKYTGKGGRIDVRVQAADANVEVIVKDNGPGIPPADLERIFELFTQVDQTLERSHGGLGIGLTLVKNLMELQHGRVHAFSAGPGHGSEFRIEMPRQSDAGERPSPSTKDSSVRPPLPRLSILVVDDAIASAKMLSLMVKSLGQDVEMRHDGPSAIEAAQTLRPQLILLDIAMPGMSGYDAVKRMRELPELKETVIVAMTGFGQDSDRKQALDSGFDHHMIKPAAIDDLAELIRETGEEKLEARS